MNAAIFVQIPAYRDRELLPTLESLFGEAHQPERLRVCVAWQYGEDEIDLRPTLQRMTNVDLLAIPAEESQGCNWARSLLQARYDGEPYTLFLDSHHRFVAGWDEQVVALFERQRRAGIAKPVLTSYLPPYDPRRDPDGRASSLFRIQLSERHEGMLFRLVGHPVDDPDAADSPMPANFTSLHFLFAAGAFNEEVPFDSLIYFFADEVAIALRAFTHGYELLHPHRTLGWHLYDRATRVTHWNDHVTWRQMNEVSSRRLRALYRGRLRGRYGIGRTHSIAEYEARIGMPLIAAGA